MLSKSNPQIFGHFYSFFFFSSRRRHTRCSRDWSSDVCSSDLDPASLLTRLKSSNKDIERGRAIGQWRDKYPDPKHVPEVRRWLSQVGEHADDLLVLLPAPRSLLPKVVESIRAAKDPLTVKDLAVKGDDLLAAGVRPGPDVGETLERLLAEVLEDPSRNT